MKQNELLLSISKLIPKDKSLIDIVSSVLDISYASAHRRVSNTAKISIDEAVILAKHFNISLDMVFNTGDKNIIPVLKTEITNNISEITNHLEGFHKNFKLLSKMKEARIIYCAKDLPIANTSFLRTLTKFKIFVCLKELSQDFKNKSYANFDLTPSLIKEHKALGVLYNQLNVVEIWDVTTINSTLKQILYYSSTKQLSNEQALVICKELKELILNYKEKATSGSNLQLYYNELQLMGNKMFVKTPLGSSLYLQYTSMNFFNTKDKDTCDHTDEYLQRLLKKCKLINTSSEKERNSFFNKMFNKIDSLYEHISAQRDLDF